MRTDSIDALLATLRRDLRHVRQRINEDVTPLALRMELLTTLARLLDLVNGLEAARAGCLSYRAEGETH